MNLLGWHLPLRLRNTNRLEHGYHHQLLAEQHLPPLTRLQAVGNNVHIRTSNLKEPTQEKDPPTGSVR